MKSTFLLSLLFVFFIGEIKELGAKEELSPYFLVGNVTKSMGDATSSVKDALTAQGFIILGEYSPENISDFRVIAYTREDLQKITLQVKDRGMLASVLKIGLKKNGEMIAVTMLNPIYLFHAYLRDECGKHLTGLTKVSDDAKKAMQAIGNEFTGFGGSEEIKDLKDYHYMAFMPYFDDAIDLNSFNSFKEGVNRIRANLNAKKGNTLKVYELVLENEKVAVFGVGLLDPEKGEKKFLPVIGEDHIAAMPYEIILMDTEASMLHGKFRFALHWPELSMSQFMKISSTPGDVEDFLKAITE